jgi:serine/threonine protein kinase
MPDASTLLTTTLADRYRIERELGRGGMATGYLAEDLRHDRRVAIKVLHPNLAVVPGGIDGHLYHAASHIVVIQNFPELACRLAGGRRPD